MNFEVKPTEKPRSRWPFVLIGALVVLAAVGLFFFFGGQPTTKSPAEKPLPFNAAAQAYAPNVRFENLKLSRFANMFNQEVTYLAGDVVNQGNRTIANVQVTLEFRNVENKVVMKQTRRVLGMRPVPIPPGGRSSFRLGFEGIPNDWNMADPAIQVTGLVLR